MKDIVEIRWHGRGGQGAKTASLLLADAAFNTGKYVQGFPEYGPERMGAPITAYNRISSERSTVHSNIYFPDYVVVVDETLLSAVDVTAGLKAEGAIVINSGKSPDALRPLLKGYEGKVCTIDADRISEEELGKPFPFEEELRDKTARMILLDAELNLDASSGGQSEKVVAKSERPSILNKLKNTPARTNPGKPPKHHEEVR